MIQLWLVICAALTFFGMGFIVWHMYETRKSKESPDVEAAYLRGAAVIDVPEYGLCTVRGWKPETYTSGHLVVEDYRGVLRTVSEVHVHELHEKDKIQCLVGDGPPQWELIRSDHARERQMRYAGIVGGTAQALRFKEAAEEAERDAKLARLNVEQEVDKSIERTKDVPQKLPVMK